MKLGRISAIFRYPVKSMAGEVLDVARLSWHGIEGDRRCTFGDSLANPWQKWVPMADSEQITAVAPL
jgi:uncharacterized protein YcbX